MTSTGLSRPEQVVRRSDALRHWRAAYDLAASTAARHRFMADLGADGDLLRAEELEVTRTAAEAQRLYTLLTPADKATADRITKETKP